MYVPSRVSRGMKAFMKEYKSTLYEMRKFLTLWLGQSLSALGSSMTAYALVIWSYGRAGSALMTALLMVCSYTPYVVFSIFAGTLADRWNKKVTMLACDSMAALTTAAVLILLKTDCLEIWHIYIVNAIGGLMNTVQQPASEVAVTRLLPKKYFQKVGGLRYLSNSVNTILTPVIATAMMGVLGMEAVLYFDLSTFLFAALTLLWLIQIPGEREKKADHERFLSSAREGAGWLREHRGILCLILFLAAVNLVASMYNAAFPAMMLSRAGGSQRVMGTVNTVTGLSMLLGSVFASFRRPPRSRVRVICNCLLFSMSTENLLLALGRNVWVWSIAGFLGWITIPLMNANLDAILRSETPVSMQGRVYAVRNSLQFFTIPVGYLLGGVLVDYVFEPVMASQNHPLLTAVFGSGKGSGAALFFFVLAFLGVGVCLGFRRNRAMWAIERTARQEEGAGPSQTLIEL